MDGEAIRDDIKGLFGSDSRKRFETKSLVIVNDSSQKSHEGFFFEIKRVLIIN